MIVSWETVSLASRYQEVFQGTDIVYFVCLAPVIFTVRNLLVIV